MFFWFFMAAMVLLIPVTMIMVGQLFLRNSPRTINAMFGYRTKMSMLNQDTWDFAHAHCGALWRRIGIVLLPVSLLLMLPFWGKDADTVGCAGAAVELFQCVILLLSVLPTEHALRLEFDEDGKRRKE